MALRANEPLICMQKTSSYHKKITKGHELCDQLKESKFTTTATLDLIQDYQKKEDIEHIRKDMIPSPPPHQDMLKGSSSLSNSSSI
jgi:hypothetical protein